MRSNNHQSPPTVLARIVDILLTCLVLPALAAVVYACVLAYKTYHPPRKPIRRRPEDFNLQAIPVKIPVKDSRIVLDAWFIPAEGSPHTVIAGHGIGRNKDFALPYAAFLHRAGYNVVAFDHRNHGKSSTDRAVRAMSRRFTDDIEAVVSFVQNRPELAHGCITIFSFSFSTYPAIYIMKRPSCHIQAVICDSGPSVSDQLTYRRVLDSSKMSLPGIFRGPILYWILKTVYANIAHLMLSVVGWPPKLSHLPVKLLFIANEEDTIIPPAEVKPVADLHPDAELWVAPRTPHLMAIRTDEETYRNLILRFLQQAVALHSTVGEPSSA